MFVSPDVFCWPVGVQGSEVGVHLVIILVDIADKLQGYSIGWHILGDWLTCCMSGKHVVQCQRVKVTCSIWLPTTSTALQARARRGAKWNVGCFVLPGIIIFTVVVWDELFNAHFQFYIYT
jgi:hypothetical protein